MVSCHDQAGNGTPLDHGCCEGVQRFCREYKIQMDGGVVGPVRH